MTVDTIERLNALIKESWGRANEVECAFEYRNAYNNELLFAAFTHCCYCDIYESPAVLNPICIYKRGFWIGKYLFMNKVI